jgi:RNA polymerase sigma-70 factor (ECF subfamily)
MSDDVTPVIREHAPFIWRTLRHLGTPDAQLEDLSQEVFVVIFRKLGAFEGRSTLRTWIYGVCRNVAANAARRRARMREQLSDVPVEVAAPEGQTLALARQQARAQLNKVLQGLPEQTRMVFVLFEIERLSMCDVAEALGCNESTAYSRLYVARSRVRAALTRGGLIEPGQDLAEVV